MRKLSLLLMLLIGATDSHANSKAIPPGEVWYCDGHRCSRESDSEFLSGEIFSQPRASVLVASHRMYDGPVAFAFSSTGICKIVRAKMLKDEDITSASSCRMVGTVKNVVPKLKSKDIGKW